jgi:hypothetical protein
MVLFSVGVIGQKIPTTIENTGFPIGFSRYFLSGFAMLLGIFLKPLELGPEFNYASNGTGLDGGHNQKVVLTVEI